jgi:hypothetical protein
MKPISVHVEEDNYRTLKALAERSARPVADVIREALAEYAAHRSGTTVSIFDLQPHPSGALLAPWTRAELLDERLGR